MTVEENLPAELAVLAEVIQRPLVAQLQALTEAIEGLRPASDGWSVRVVETHVGQPTCLVDEDSDRLRVQLINSGANLVLIGASRDALTKSESALLLVPSGSLSLDTTAPVWAMSAESPAGAGPSEVSVLVEGRTLPK